MMLIFIYFRKIMEQRDDEDKNLNWRLFFKISQNTAFDGLNDPNTRGKGNTKRSYHKELMQPQRSNP